MAYIPVICDYCGTLFGMRNFMAGYGTVTMVGNVVGPCPNCGGMGRVPDGTYEFAGNAVRLLQAPSRTVDELRQFANILQDILQGTTGIAQAQTTVRHTIPDLAPLVEELRETRNAQLRMFAVKVILTLVGFLLASQQVNVSIQDIDIDVHDIINITIEQEAQPPPDSP